MQVDDLDISPSKIGESAQRIVDRAIEEARRREHALLTNEHIFLAFAQAEWDMFSEVMRDIDLNPHTILQAIEEHLHMMPSFAGRDLRVSPATIVFICRFTTWQSRRRTGTLSGSNSMRCASPSAMAVLPTPGSPTSITEFARSR